MPVNIDRTRKPHIVRGVNGSSVTLRPVQGKGETGVPGPTGSQGPAGQDGAVGATGPQGPVNTDAIAKSLLPNKGDLVVGTGVDNTPTRLPVGADGTVMVADSTQTSGWRFFTHKILEGTGFPTMDAPVGSEYIDLAQTNGARTWRKTITGSGTAKWVVSDGDTGWRNLVVYGQSSPTFTFATGWAWASTGGSTLAVRRFSSDRVRLRVVGLLRFTGAAGLAKPILNEEIPAGFQSYYSLGLIRTAQPLGVTGIGPSNASGILVADATGTGSTDISYAQSEWVADGTVRWPSSSPGTPG